MDDAVFERRSELGTFLLLRAMGAEDVNMSLNPCGHMGYKELSQPSGTSASIQLLCRSRHAWPKITA
jgi:hypothetical protein